MLLSNSSQNLRLCLIRREGVGETPGNLGLLPVLAA